MANVQSKENMTIAIREYTDNQGQQKKVWKTIGELITWDDGSKSFELWGPTGSTKGNVFAKDDNNQQNNQQQVNQGGYAQNNQQQAPQQQGNYQQGQGFRQS
jgi:single-stranded DNA-binding protein